MDEETYRLEDYEPFEYSRCYAKVFIHLSHLRYLGTKFSPIISYKEWAICELRENQEYGYVKLYTHSPTQVVLGAPSLFPDVVAYTGSTGSTGQDVGTYVVNTPNVQNHLKHDDFRRADNWSFTWTSSGTGKLSTLLPWEEEAS